MQARINICGVLELEVESTTEYWAVQEWLKQVTLTYEVIDTSSPQRLAEQKVEKFKAIDLRFIEIT